MTVGLSTGCYTKGLTNTRVCVVRIKWKFLWTCYSLEVVAFCRWEACEHRFWRHTCAGLWFLLFPGSLPVCNFLNSLSLSLLVHHTETEIPKLQGQPKAWSDIWSTCCFVPGVRSALCNLMLFGILWFLLNYWCGSPYEILGGQKYAKQKYVIILDRMDLKSESRF